MKRSIQNGSRVSGTIRRNGSSPALGATHSVGPSRTVPAMLSASPLKSVGRQRDRLKLLPSAVPGNSAAKLSADVAHEGYIVSRRTVERDLSGLQNRFPIKRGKEQPIRSHWAAGRMQVLGMSMTGAFALHQPQASWTHCCLQRCAAKSKGWATWPARSLSSSVRPTNSPAGPARSPQFSRAFRSSLRPSAQVVSGRAARRTIQIILEK